MTIRTKKRVVILGHTGKLGRALYEVFQTDYEVIGLNTDDFDASYIDQTSDILQRYKPDIVFNAVAYLGIDPCENNPALAVKLNCLHPGVLAELSNKLNFVLVHVSTDAVFNDEKRDVYVESDLPNPVNHYGMTKYETRQYGITKYGITGYGITEYCISKYWITNMGLQNMELQSM